MAKGTRFTDTEKASIMKEASKKTAAEVAEKYGINPVTISKWKRKAKRKVAPKKTVSANGKSSGVGEVDGTELTRHLVELSREVNYWKNKFLELYKEKNP